MSTYLALAAAQDHTWPIGISVVLIVSECALVVFNILITYIVRCYWVDFILARTNRISRTTIFTICSSIDVSLGRASSRVNSIHTHHSFEHSRSKLKQYLALNKCGPNHFAHSVGDVCDLSSCNRWYRWWGKMHPSPHVRINTLEAAFVSWCNHMCGDTRVNMCWHALNLSIGN